MRKARLEVIATKSLSLIWGTINHTRRHLYDQGILKSEKLPSRVISVGNLQVGGAGKTPLVTQIALEGVARDLKVCILTRGYRGQWESSGGVIHPGSEFADPQLCGDEAALLHERVKQAWIGVGADRVSSFRRVCDHLKGQPDLVILDDGFQHRRVARDLDVLALTSATSEDVLYRERASAASRGDFLVWTKGETRPEAFGRPLVKVQYVLPPPDVSFQKIWLFAGVAAPEDVLKTAKSAGYTIEKFFQFSDHQKYDEKDLLKWVETSERNNVKIALTGKDWVKWRQLLQKKKIQNLRLLEPELEFLEGRETWVQALWGNSP
jgi:tetraacyldisaccharide 4'-kinase